MTTTMEHDITDFYNRFRELQLLAKTFGIKTLVILSEDNPIAGGTDLGHSYEGDPYAILGMARVFCSRHERELVLERWSEKEE